MEQSEIFERWFARLGAHVEQAAARFQHPVAALSGYPAEVYVRVLSERDGPMFVEHGARRVFWVAHPSVPAQVVTVEKPEGGDVAKYQVSAFNLCDAAFGIRKGQLDYDVYELSDMDVVVVAAGPLVRTAADELVIHLGDGTGPTRLQVPPLRRPYEPE